MTASAVFSIANTVALAAWVALLVRPQAAWVQRVVGTVVPGALSVAYVVVMALRLGRVDGGFDSLEGVAALFSDRTLLLGGWIHYLAFDLLVGGWISRDAAARGLARWKVAPFLVLTFLFGPAGWLGYRLLARASGTPAGAGRAEAVPG